VPFLIVCYFVAYLDRVNVGFAALTMNRDINISQTAYGLGALNHPLIPAMQIPR